MIYLNLFLLTKIFQKLGDSGGGLFIKYKDVYYLRGIVSSSLISDDLCDVNNYAVFTDVIKLKDWIKLKKDQVKNEECGVMSASTGLIQGGEFSTRKEFPWMASVVIKNGLFNLSAVLLSHRHVLASGLYSTNHVGNSQKFNILALDRVKIYLAALKHDESEHVFSPSKMALHPHVKEIDGVTIINIMVLTLSKSVEFSDFIRPICLWTGCDDSNLIKNSPIFVAGYGVDESGKISNIKKHAKVTLTDNATCRSKYSKITEEIKYLCIKGSKQGAPCDYDRYIFVKYFDKWFVRGVFLKRFVFSNGTCRVDDPFLFEDIAKHTKWIQTQIEL